MHIVAQVMTSPSSMEYYVDINQLARVSQQTNIT